MLFRISNARLRQPTAQTMPTPSRTITVAFPVDLIQHLDARARERGCSRAAFLRFLALADRQAQG